MDFSSKCYRADHKSKTVEQIKNASDWLSSRLVPAEERISKFENIPIENSLTEMQREEEIKKRKNKISRNHRPVLRNSIYM